MDRGAWWAAVHRVAKSRTRMRDFIFTFHFHALEKEMATHSSVLAWRIPGTVEPGGLPSMGLQRVRHDWSDLAAAAAAGFSSTWTMNFQMCNLDLDKVEKPEIKLPTSAGSSKKQEFQKNIYFCFIDCAKAFDCVDHNKLWKILKEMWIPDHLTWLLRNLHADQEATVRIRHETTD